MSSIIQDNLYKIIGNICENRTVIREKGLKALERIKKECRLVDRAAVLERIYREAMGVSSPEHSPGGNLVSPPAFAPPQRFGIAAMNSVRTL